MQRIDLETLENEYVEGKDGQIERNFEPRPSQQRTPMSALDHEIPFSAEWQ